MGKKDSNLLLPLHDNQWHHHNKERIKNMFKHELESKIKTKVTQFEGIITARSRKW